MEESLDEQNPISKHSKRCRAQLVAAPEQEEYEITGILDERKTKRGKGKSSIQLLVRWKDTWVYESNVDEPVLLHDFRIIKRRRV